MYGVVTKHKSLDWKFCPFDKESTAKDFASRQAVAYPESKIQVYKFVSEVTVEVNFKTST